MYKTFLSLSTALGLVLLGLALTPAISRAAENKPDAHKESLQRTQSRLDALIKAAARQDLVNINNKPGKNSVAVEPAVKTEHPKACTPTNVFTFPPATRVDKYEDLLLLKAGMITGPDQIDMDKAEALALAYLGLGFGEEALMTAGTLDGPKKLAIGVMAKTLMGLATKDDADFMQAQAECYAGANMWAFVMQDIYTPLPVPEIDQLVEQIEGLPKNLRNTLGQRLGIKAVQNADLKTATALYKILLEAQPEHSDTGQAVLSADLQFLEALLAVNSSDANKKAAGIKKIKSFAKNGGPYQAHALQALSGHLPKDEDIYPGFMQDLDAAAQTYSDHPLGKQAQAQKMALLAKNHDFKTAIDLVKASFEVGSKYFEDGVVTIGRYVQSDLLDDDKRKKISALEILISEESFFSHLKDAKLLKQAGIYACAQLGLPNLALQIIPMSEWKNLDTKTLNLLAISYSMNSKNPDVTAGFPKHVFEQPEFKAKEIEQAFAGKNPNKAIAIRRKLPENDIIQNAFIKSSWNEGYWSLANNGIRKKRLSSPSAKETLPRVKQELAATLSVASSLLLTSGRSYAINDLAALQSHLNNELGLFKHYLNPGETPKESADNG
ncbi:MAG: hypothetical protein JKY25_08305 [Robiginitomaculum sp.]|nr:hypothetical protein [Robiginitomaculum sp.]